MTLSSRLVAWLGVVAAAARTGGAAGAIGTYRAVTEMRVELRALAPRVDALERDGRTDDRARNDWLRSIDTRLSRLEGALGVRS